MCSFAMILVFGPDTLLGIVGTFQRANRANLIASDKPTSFALLQLSTSSLERHDAQKRLLPSFLPF